MPKQQIVSPQGIASTVVFGEVKVVQVVHVKRIAPRLHPEWPRDTVQRLYANLDSLPESYPNRPKLSDELDDILRDPPLWDRSEAWSRRVRDAKQFYVQAGLQDDKETKAPSAELEKELPPFDKLQAKTLVIARKYSVWKEPPTEAASCAFLKKQFRGVPNDPHRKLRHELWPGQIRRGPKKREKPTAN
jgi:hypothetical protein